MKPAPLWQSAVCAAVLACACALGLLTASPTASALRHGPAVRGLDCSLCHTAESWVLPAQLRGTSGFEHDRTGFPLRGGHQLAACVQCHDGRSSLSHQCNACHLDEHRGALGKDCDRCHTVSTFKVSDSLALHSRTRLPLTGMHALVECSDCHRRSGPERYSSTPPQCFACHEKDYRRPGIHPVHDGTGGNPAFPRDCTECHQPSAFSPAFVEKGRFLGSSAAELRLAPRDHDRVFTLSHGPHRDAPCATCHVDLSHPRYTRCTGCHAHGRAQLAAQHPKLGAPTDGSCLACHPGGSAR